MYTGLVAKQKDVGSCPHGGSRRAAAPAARHQRNSRTPCPAGYGSSSSEGRAGETSSCWRSRTLTLRTRSERRKCAGNCGSRPKNKRPVHRDHRGVLRTRFDGRYHKVAPSNNDWLRLNARRCSVVQFHETLPPDTAGLHCRITRALSSRKRVDVEYAIETRGRSIWFSGTVTPIGEDRVLWVARDVSDAKISAEALKESEARFRNLVSTHRRQWRFMPREGSCM